MLSQETMNALFVVGLIVLIVSFMVMSVGPNHSGRPGFPCYCKTCEQKLITAAKNGDVQAMKKLSIVIEDGVYKDQNSYMLGPFASILGFFIVGIIVIIATSVLGFFSQKTGAGQYVEAGIKTVGEFTQTK